MNTRLTVSPQIHYFTDDELFALCQANPDLKIERDEHGNLIIIPPTGLETSFKNNDLNFEINLWNRRTRLGRVSDSNGGYTLPDTSMRAPDVAWVSHERLATVSPDDLKRFAHVCPDFVIELMSENDSRTELDAKMKKWIQNGVRLGWFVSPKDRQVLVYLPGQELPQTCLFTDTLTGYDGLPGFVLRLSDLF